MESLSESGAVRAGRPSRVRELVTMAEYARMRGCSKAAVTKAVKRGQLHLVDRLVDPVEADRTWPRTAGPPAAASPEPSQSPVRSASTPGPPPKPGVNGKGPGNSGTRPGDLDYWDARADSEWHKARLLELDLAEREGRLLDAKEVERDLFEGYRAVREALLTVPDRVSGTLAGESNADVIYRILTAEIRQALEQLHARYRPAD